VDLGMGEHLQSAGEGLSACGTRVTRRIFGNLHITASSDIGIALAGCLIRLLVVHLGMASKQILAVERNPARVSVASAKSAPDRTSSP